MESININGTEYVPADSIAADWSHVCVICTNGWIFEGYADPGEPWHLTRAHVVRKWSNGLGIGGLADPEHKDDYTLDAVGDMRIRASAEVARIALRW